MKMHHRILFSDHCVFGKVLRKTIALGLVCSLICGAALLRVAANDAPLLSDWAKEEALLAEQQGLLPQERLYGALIDSGSRRHAAGYLVHLAEMILHQEIPNTSQGVFSDLEGHSSKTVDAAEKAHSAGIVVGYENHRFAPSKEITREEYATMVFRTLQYIERNQKVRLFPNEQAENGYLDSDSISPWAEQAVTTLSNIGVFCGQSDGTFNPKGLVSLEQMIVVSYRCWEYCTARLS